MKLYRNSLSEARSKFTEEKQNLEAKIKQQQEQLSKAFDDQRSLTEEGDRAVDKMIAQRDKCRAALLGF